MKYNFEWNRHDFSYWSKPIIKSQHVITCGELHEGTKVKIKHSVNNYLSRADILNIWCKHIVIYNAYYTEIYWSKNKDDNNTVLLDASECDTIDIDKWNEMFDGWIEALDGFEYDENENVITFISST